jgi:aldose 1-epimerase
VRIEQINLSNEHGFSAEVLNYGAIIKSLKVPVGEHSQNVVLGYENISDYLSDPYYLGATIGRYANRIANAAIVIDGKAVALPANEGANLLHGGEQGFHCQYWTIEQVSADSVILSYLSPDGEMGFPGDLHITQKISLTKSSLRIEYIATTTKPTVVSLTNHSYFNLANHSNNIDDHQVKIFSNYYTPVTYEGLPTGNIQPVVDTPFDLNCYKEIDKQLQNFSHHKQIIMGSGYDHNFILTAATADKVTRKVAELFSPTTRLLLTLNTSQPCMQLYTGNYLDRSFIARNGVCLEAQGYPDGPNQADFSTGILLPKQEYHQIIEYQFTKVI